MQSEPPAFYETWGFKVGAIVLGGLGIWAYTLFRLHYTRHLNKVLETRIDERTNALKTTLAELQASEEALRKQTHIQEKLITAITHDIKSPLRYMMLAARRLSDHTAMGNDGRELHKNARMLYEAGYRMYHLTDNLLQYIKLSGRNREVVLEKVNLAALIQEKIEIFRDIAANQQTVFVQEVNAGITVLSNYHLLGIIIHNLLDNAVKVTYEGKINIYVEEDECLRLVIADTGIGMRPEMVDWCNKTLVAGEGPEEALPGQGGFGLPIIKELLAIMGGKMWVSSSLQKGTRIALWLPAR